jgi:hypothetical protein
MRPTLRSAIALACVLALTGLLAWRIKTLRAEPHLALSARVYQLMYDRTLAQWVQAYAAAYGRPAFSIDSVLAHLDTADANTVDELLTDMWGRRVHYGWDYCSFALSSTAGWRTPRERQIFEHYSWPVGVGRTHDCFEP